MNARESDGNVLMAIVGALAGATVGAIVYYAVMAISGFQIGYIAILVGVASGYGSLILGKSPSHFIGALCAISSLSAIACAEYAYYKQHVNEAVEAIQPIIDSITVESYSEPPVREDYDNELDFQSANEEHARFTQMSPEEQQLYVEDYKQSLRHSFLDYTFTEYLTEDTTSLIITCLFGFFGILYGYKVGAGVAGDDE